MAGGLRHTVILLCGPLAVGKSSIARRLGELLPNSRVISTEAFKQRAYRRLMKALIDGLGRYRYIILDGTFYRRRWRERVREIVGDDGRVFTILLRAPLEVCLRRNRERAGPIPEGAVHIIWKEFEWPEEADLEVETDKIDVEEAVKLILERVRRWEEEP
ncbi:MAG: hypothetical protein AYL28_004640 [Candidatus Bathyarchaeota archaeon B23]|nr:MAG: hypothetical protein AYL28_004640 [Candidatus Bathyarchaeota archaeon B23]